MKHGRFLATTLSSVLLASSFCAAVNPSYRSQGKALEYILKSFDKGNKVSATETDLDNVEQILEGDYRFDPYKEVLKCLYGKLYSVLKNNNYFFKTDDGYEIPKYRKGIGTIGELADCLLTKRIDGYRKANEDWRNCCHFVMCEVLKII